jgi:hypothetical protein
MKTMINQAVIRTEKQKPPNNMRDIGFSRDVNEIFAVSGCYAVKLVVSKRRFGTLHRSALQGSSSQTD